jgi:hypothetical protein
MAEREYLKKKLAERGLALTNGQLTNALQLQASHIRPELDSMGNKVWTNMDNLIPDLGYVNGYVNDLGSKNNRFMKMLLEEAQTNPAAMKKAGIDIASLERISKGIHPTTEKEIATLRGIAKKHMAFLGPNSDSFYRPLMVDEGLAYRQQTGYYKKPIPTYQQRINSGQFKGLKVGKAKASANKNKTATVPVPKGAQAFKLSSLLGRGAGAFGAIGLAASLLPSLMQNRYKDGIVSVPGPKGAGDVVPAMLSPGESVIPSKISKKYAPLIGAMISDSIPGYDGGLFDYPPTPPRGLSGDYYDFSKPPAYTTPTPATPKISDRAASLMGKGMGAVMGASKLIAGGLKTGVTAAFSNAKDKAAIAGMNLLAGKEQGGVYALPSGKVYNPETGKTFSSYDAYSKDHQRNEEIRVNRKPGTSYVTSTGKVYQFDENGKARSLTGEAKAAAIGSAQAAPANEKAPLRQRIAGPMGVAGGALSMAGMGMSMSGDPTMQQAGGAVMMAGMAMSVLPLLMTKLGALAAVAGTVAWVWMSTNAAIDKAREKSIELANAFGTSAESISKYAEFAGNVTGSEIMQRRNENMFNLLPIQPGKTTFGSAFAQSEAGQQIIKNAQLAKASGMNVTDALYSQLRDSVLSGAMDVTQARSIATAISNQLKDYKLGIDLQGKITSLFGPGGENLSEGQLLSIRIKAVAESVTETQTQIQNAISEGLVRFDPDDLGTRLGIWAESWVPDWITGGDDTTERLQKYQDGLAGISEGYSSVFSGIGSSLAELDAGFIEKIEAAKAAGDMEEANTLEKRWLEQRGKLTKEYQGIVNSVATTWGNIIRASASSDKDPLTTIEDLRLSQNTSILSGFEKDSEEYKNAKTLLEKFDEITVDGLGLGKTKGGFTIKALFDAGQISQSSFKTITDLLASGDTDTTAILNMVTKFGAAQTDKITQVAGLFVDKDGKPIKKMQASFIAKISTMKLGDAESYLDMFIQASKLGWVVDTTLVLSTIFEDEKKSTELLRQLDEISKLDTTKPMTIEYVQKTTQLGDATMAALKADQEYFEKLDPVQQVTYLQTIATLSVAGEGALPSYETWAAENTKRKATGYDRNRGVPTFETVKPSFDKYLAFLGGQVTNIQGLNDLLNQQTNGGDDGGGTKTDPFEDLLNRLKRIRNAAINAKGGVAEFLKVLKGGSVTESKFGTATTNLFRGVDQKLLAAGYNREFIETVMSMDEETRANFISIKNGMVKVTEKGELLKAMLSELALGDYQFSLVADIADINKQMTAMNRLVGAGLSVSDASKIAQDSQLAYAIATAATSEEVAILVHNFKALEIAQKNLQLSTPQGVQEWLGDQLNEVSSAIGQVNEYFAAQEAVIEQDFGQGTNTSGRNASKYNMKQLQSDIDSAAASIATYEYQIDDLEYLLDGIASKEDKINEKYDKRLEALDAVFNANRSIEEQQKSQLDIVNALAQGDIAGAARAAQEDQRRRAEQARETQKKIIEKSRETEIAGVRATNGKSRLDLEKQISDLQTNIVKLEEEKLEPAQRSLDLAEAARDVALEAIGKEGYLGKTKTEWENIENAARLAVVQSDAFGKSIKDTLKALPGFTEILDAEGKFAGFKFDPAAYKKWLTENSQQQTVPDPIVVSNPNDGKTTNPNQAKIDELNRLVQISRWRVQNEKLSATVKDALMDMNVDRITEIKKLGGTPNMTGTIKPAGYAMGGMVKPKYFNVGGFAMGTDTVPAMLTPGEFVIRKYAVDNFGVDKLKAINSGSYSGDSVYNYDINVNVKSNANADEIARTVISQIRQIDSQRIRGNRL